jgi:predicted secreted protein
MKILLRAAFLCAVLMTIGSAQAADKLHYNVISLQAIAEQDVENDLMQVGLSVEHQHKQSSQAAARVNQDSQWALETAKKFPSVKATTQNYSTQPRYDDRRVIGWVVRQQVFLESEDFEQLAELVTVLQKKLQVNRMSFSPTKATRLAAENALTTEALQAFQAKAEQITQALGQDKYEVVDIQLGGRPHVRPMMRQADMMSASVMEKSVAVEAGTSTLQVTASGRIQLR